MRAYGVNIVRLFTNGGTHPDPLPVVAAGSAVKPETATARSSGRLMAERSLMATIPERQRDAAGEVGAPKGTGYLASRDCPLPAVLHPVRLLS